MRVIKLLFGPRFPFIETRGGKKNLLHECSTKHLIWLEQKAGWKIER